MADACDVLVVGAGPTGMMLAGELWRRGVRARVIDKAPAPTTQSRAIAVHARTLEICDELGIADELIARGVRVGGVAMHAGGKPLVQIELGALDTKFPFVLSISQVETEGVLRALLARRGGSIERDVELVSLAQDAGGVDATLRGPAGEERVRAKWIVGCDGAHSATRKALGAAFTGHTYEETFLLADVKIAWDEPTSRISTFFAQDGIAACFPMLDGRWRVIITAAESLGDKPTLDEVSALVAKRCARPVTLEDAVWIAPFRIHCRQVERYRHGRVFLAGDAAHIHSPIGGQGMNTGIQDAHNLAWKLALAIRGHAGDTLLDSYQAERHAIGKDVLKQTDLLTKVGTVTGLLVPLRNQLIKFATSFEPVRRSFVADTTQLAVGYEDSPIVEERVGSLLATRLGRVEAAESPNVGSRLSFGAGPKPGARAVDAACSLSRGGGAPEPTRLSRLLGGGFTLLLFDGRAATYEGYASLVSIARRAREAHGELVAPLIVTPTATRPRAIGDELPVLLDEHGELEARYGARSECLYLIRPDLYVSFRSQPANGDALAAHLARVLG